MDLEEIKRNNPFDTDYIGMLNRLEIDRGFAMYISKILASLEEEKVSTAAKMNEFIRECNEAVKDAIKAPDDSKDQKLGSLIIKNYRLFYLSHAYVHICKALYFAEKGDAINTMTQLFKASQDELFFYKIDIGIESLKAHSHQVQGGKTSSQRFDAARDLCVEVATDAWKGENGIRIGEIANQIKKIIDADPKALGLSISPTLQVIKKWIRPLAPKEAKRPGRPTKT